MRRGYLSELFVSFQGEGAHLGRRHLFVRFAGCNLRCRYCDTPDSLERTPQCNVFRDGKLAARHPNPLSAAQAAGLVHELLDQEPFVDALAFTGGEPLVQSEFVSDVLRLGNFGRPVLLETAGVLARRLPEVLPWVDIVSMDIKLPSNSGEPPFWAEHALFLECAREKELYVKVLVDEDSADEEVERAASLVAAAAPTAPVFLQPLVDAAGHPALGAGRLTRFFALARRHGAAVRVVPQTHKVLGIQ